MNSFPINKRLGWLLCFQFLICTTLLAQWAPLQYPGIIGGDFPVINAMDFTNDMTGVAVSDNGLIVRTENGGIEWDTIYDISEAYTFQEVLYYSDARIVAVGHKTVDPGCVATPSQGIIAYSLNTGNSWDTVSVEYSLNAVDFPTAQTGYAVGDCGRMYQSTDGGENWVEIAGPGGLENLEDIDFPTETTGYIGRTDGSVLRTLNSAADWTTFPIGLSGSTGYVQFFNELEGVTVGIDVGGIISIMATTDGGENWNPFSPFAGNELAFMLDVTRGYTGQIGVGLVGYITESGDNIEFQEALPPAPEVWPIKRVIHFYDENTGYIAGPNTFYSFIPPLTTQNISGVIFVDENDDCLLDGGENGLKDWIVKIENEDNNEAEFITTDAQGNYNFTLDTGNYVLNVFAPNSTRRLCINDVQVDLNTPGGNTVLDIGSQIDSLCPVMEIDISTPMLSRCEMNRYYVSYYNRGTATAIAPRVEIIFDDDFEVLASNPVWTDVSDSLYTYELEDLMPGDSGKIFINTFLSCTTPFEGQTHGVIAKIFPDNLCDTLNPVWDQSSVSVSGECAGDSVTFEIRNTGTGDIQAALDYIVIEDHILLTRGNFDLSAGLETAFVFYPNGGTLRLEADQSEGHPGRSMPSVAIEGCGLNEDGEFSLGFVTQDPEDDLNTFISIENQESIDSINLNFENQIFAYPKGYGNANFIKPNTSIEYRIPFRFNSPLDSTVIIRTVPSSFQDIATIVPGVSSHIYDFSIVGGDTLEFKLQEPIQANEAGFIKFRIDQKTDNPDGTIIHHQYHMAVVVVDDTLSLNGGSYTHNVSTDSLSTSANGLIIDGEILDYVSNPVEMAELMVGEENEISTTTESGQYSFVLPGDYSQDKIVLTTSRNSNFPAGVDAYDLYLTHAFLEGWYAPEDSLQLAAADWDRNNIVNRMDLLQIQEALGNPDPVSANFPWRFLPNSPGLQYTADDQHRYTINNPTLYNRADFRALKRGDFDLSARANNAISPDTTFPLLKLEIPNLSLKAGESYELPFSMEEKEGKMLSFQWILSYDSTAIEILELLPGRLENDPNFSNLQVNTTIPGLILITWYQTKEEEGEENPELFSIRIMAQKNIQTDQLWSVENDWLFPKVYLKESPDDTKTYKPVLDTKESNTFPGILNLNPNPTRGIVFIDYQLEQGQNATIHIVDALGRLVRQYDISDQLNMSSPIELDTSTLSSGVYIVYLKINSDKIEAMKKLIVVE